MSLNDSHNNILFFGAGNRYLGHYVIYKTDDLKCKEWWHLQSLGWSKFTRILRFKSFNKDTFFVILVSLNAIMSKLVREFIRNCAFIRNKDKDLFLLGVLMLFILSMSKYLDDYLFLGPLLFSGLML